MTLTQLISRGIKGWHGVKLNQPDWSDYSHSVALSVELPEENLLVYFIFNAYLGQLEFDLPVIGNGKTFWHRWVDTYLDSPQDIVEWQTATAIPDDTYGVGSRSVVLLWASHDTHTHQETGYAT